MLLGRRRNQRLKWVLMSSSLAVLGSCTWYQQFDERSLPTRQPHHPDDSRAAAIDGYQQELSSLQQRIDALQNRLHHVQQLKQLNDSLPREADIAQQADAAVAFIKQKARVAADRIDRLIADILTAKPAKPKAPQVMQRNRGSAGRKAKSLAVATQPQILPQQSKLTGKVSTYKYSVVYVYQGKQPWLSMWDTLEGFAVTDKWRGTNRHKHIYFIYVGAYRQGQVADARKAELAELTGFTPQIHRTQAATRLALK